MTTTGRASDRAYEALRAEIIAWELPPGSVLAEVEQAARLGVSRTPLREALSRLAADGLVAPHGGRGVVVTDLSADDVRELFEVRRALEEQAARLAARRADPEPFRALAAEFAEVRDLLEHDDPLRHRYFDLVGRFDAALDAAMANGYLAAALRPVRTHLARVRRMARFDAARLLEAAREHQAIALAIADGEPELAAHATHLHLHHALQGILDHLAGDAAVAHDHPQRTEHIA